MVSKSEMSVVKSIENWLMNSNLPLFGVEAASIAIDIIRFNPQKVGLNHFLTDQDVL